MSATRVTGFDRAFVYVMLSCMTLDRATKIAAQVALEGQPPVVLVNGFAELRYVLNVGGAFGVLEALPSFVRLAITRLVPALLAIAIVLAYVRTPASLGTLRTALVCLLAGTVANLIDRLKHNGVIDFINVHLGDRTSHLTINVADLYIAAGVLLLAWHLSAAQSSQSLEKP